MLYSPFTSTNGKIKLINEIEYSDLSILQNIDEGYKIEYKSEWNDDFKKRRLPKSITSFANTDGGWLFVGINNDGTICLINKERTDFAQQIGELLKTHTSSPYPRFETKFVESPDDVEKGVLVIHIKEGLEPPYISNGTVYTRVGSASEPIPIKNRQDLDNLYSKRKETIEKWKEFCNDELYTEFQFPICSLYFYNQADNVPYTEDIKGNDQFLIDFSQYCGYGSWMYSSSDSFIFLNSNKELLTSITPSLELFRNWNFKLNFPLCTIGKLI